MLRRLHRWTLSEGPLLTVGRRHSSVVREFPGFRLRVIDVKPRRRTTKRRNAPPPNVELLSENWMENSMNFTTPSTTSTAMSVVPGNDKNIDTSNNTGTSSKTGTPNPCDAKKVAIKHPKKLDPDTIQFLSEKKPEELLRPIGVPLGRRDLRVFNVEAERKAEQIAVDSFKRAKFAAVINHGIPLGETFFERLQRSEMSKVQVPPPLRTPPEVLSSLFVASHTSNPQPSSPL